MAYLNTNGEGLGDNMLESLNKKIIEAKKSGDKFAAGVYNLVKAELLNNQKEAKPKQEMDVVKAYSKKMIKALAAYEGHAHFEELQKEIDLVKTLLPAEISEEQIQQVVNAYLSEHTDEKNIGKIIGYVKGELPDADGGLVAQVVKVALRN